MSKFKFGRFVNTIKVVSFIVFFFVGRVWGVSPTEQGESVGCWVSTGDNDNLFYAPSVDSKLAIEDYFNILDKVYKVDRVYWRAMQADQLTKYSVVRPDNFYSGSGYYLWEKHLNGEIGTGKYAVEVAHRHGMTIWGIASLFDHGAHAIVDTSKGWGPSPFEGIVRANHPEWVPVDRHNLRRMSGTICFAYPDARKTIIDIYMKIAQDSGYDGIMFHLYTEQFQARNPDEFIYNEPLVRAYKERYEIDIRKEPVDVFAMAKLQGEFLTQLFRELRTAANDKGIKVGICISALNPQYPQPWLADPEMLASGRIEVDWHTYIKEHLVDELFVYCGGNPYELVNNLLAETKDTQVQVAMLSSVVHPEAYKHFIKQGLRRVIYGGSEELEYGYKQQKSGESWDSNDFIDRLSVLSQMAKCETPLDISKIIAASKDSNVYVRRRAMATIGKLGLSDPNIISVVKLALDDSENAVRCYAVDTLLKVGSKGSIESVLQTVEKHGNFMINLAAIWDISNLPQERNNEIVRALLHDSEVIRAIGLEACCSGEVRQGLVDAIVKLERDNSDKVRWLVARVLDRMYGDKATSTLFALLDDRNPTVRNMAAYSLSNKVRSKSYWISSAQHNAINRLAHMFAAYNQQYTGTDADWGWRCIGEAIERCGPRGVEVLNRFLSQDEDKILGDHAWQILNVKQYWNGFVHEDMAEIEKGYLAHPGIRKNKPDMPTKITEPKMMPYIVQDFDNCKFVDGKASDVVNVLSEFGLWRHLDTLTANIFDVAEIGGDGNAVKLQSNGNKTSFVDGIRNDYKITDGQIDLRFRIFLRDEISSILFWFTDSGKWESNLMLTITPGGIVQCTNAKGEAVTGKVKLALEKWQTLEIFADIDKHYYTVKLADSNQFISEKITLKSKMGYNALIFKPWGKSGITYIDDIKVLATNPAWTGGNNNINMDKLLNKQNYESDKTVNRNVEIDEEASNVLSPKRVD